MKWNDNSISENDRIKRQVFYQSNSWRKLRAYKLALNPLCECEGCRNTGEVRPATEVHHLIDVSEDWSKRLEFVNLQSMCKEHHSRETMRGLNTTFLQDRAKRREFEARDLDVERLSKIVGIPLPGISEKNKK